MSVCLSVCLFEHPSEPVRREPPTLIRLGGF